MKRTALILAGAAAFDLGVVVVAAQAQQVAQTPSRTRPSTTSPVSPDPTARNATVDPAGPGGTGGCTPSLPHLPGRPTAPCEPASISDQAAAGNLTSFLPTAQPDGPSTGGVSPRNDSGPGSGTAIQDPTGPGGNGGCTPGLPGLGRPTGPCTGGPVFLRLDRVNTPRACIARQGQVVMHEGVRQCRLPAAGLEDANTAMGEISTTR